jgi:cysteine desulfurase/selenocysteine lyase
MGGGDMISQVWLDRYKPNELPWKFEGGTPDVAGAIGLGVAVDYLSSTGMDAIREHEKAITGYALKRLSEVRGIVLHGPTDVEVRGGAVSFYLEDVHPHDLAQILDQDGICIRAGHHCCHPLMRRLGVTATARASFYLYNTEAEIDALVLAVDKARALFGQEVALA